MPGSEPICEIVVPDASPLITLAYADRLDVLTGLGPEVVLIDMVIHELVRHPTPTSQQILDFADRKQLRIAETDIGREAKAQGTAFVRRHAGEQAIQQYLYDFADSLDRREAFALLLFEEHKIGRSAFVLPDNVYLLSTCAFLLTLERRGVIASATDIELAVTNAGRAFSRREVDMPPKRNPLVQPF